MYARNYWNCQIACIYTEEFFSTSHLTFSEHTRDSRCLHVVAIMLIKKICIFREVKFLGSKKGEAINVLCKLYNK